MLLKEGNQQRLIFYLKHTLCLREIPMTLSSSNSSLETDMKIENSGFPERVGTQGLRKQILRKGNSWQTPFPRDEVEGKLMKTLLQKAFQSLFVTSWLFKFNTCKFQNSLLQFLLFSWCHMKMKFKDVSCFSSL